MLLVMVLSALNEVEVDGGVVRELEVELHMDDEEA